MPKASASGGGGKASASDVRAGGAFFELFGKDGLSGVLDKAQKKVATFTTFLSRVSRTTAFAGATLAAPLALLFKGGVDRAAETARLAQQFQVPIDLMSRLQYAAEQAGVSVDEVMKDTEGRFGALIDKAPVLDPQRAKQALETQMAFKDATIALQYAMLPLLDTVTPLVKEVANFVKENAAAVQVIGTVAAGLLAFSAATSVAGFALSGVVMVLKALVIGIGLLANPIGWVAAALVGLGYLFVTQTETGRETFDSLKRGFQSTAETAKQAWGGITAAIKNGDLELAAKIALAGLSLEWAKAVLWLTEKWNWFKGGFVDGWRDIVAGAKLIFWDFSAWIGRQLAALINGIVQAGAWVASKLGFDEFAGKLRAATISDENINRNRDRIKAEILDERAKAQAAANAAREKDAAGARADVEAAAQNLNNLVAQAKGGAAKPGEVPDYLKYQTAAAKGFDAVKGSFQTYQTARQQFGYGDAVQQQTELQKRIANAAENTAKGVDKLNNALEMK